MERWWNGTEWTEYTRTAPVPGDQAAAQPPYGAQPYGQQPYGGYPPGAYPSGDVISGGSGKRRTSTVVLAIVAALVVIGGVIAGVLVLGKGSGDNTASKPTTSPTGGIQQGGGSGGLGGDNGGQSDGGQSDGGQSDGGQEPDDPGSGGTVTGPGTAVDSLDGISLPVLKGWTGENSSDTTTANAVTGSYNCPQDPTSSCVRGGVFAQPALALELKSTTAEAAAKEDIAGNAEQSYGSDIYGKTTSHQQLASEAVTVAGKKGYMVRWKVNTASGTSGYVESLAFPSPTRDLLVVVRFGFDVGGKAPSLSTMDTITKGIKAASGSSSSDGSGGTGV
jgi:hypothetical protein